MSTPAENTRHRLKHISGGVNLDDLTNKKASENNPSSKLGDEVIDTRNVRSVKQTVFEFNKDATKNQQDKSIILRRIEQKKSQLVDKWLTLRAPQQTLVDLTTLPTSSRCHSM